MVRKIATAQTFWWHWLHLCWGTSSFTHHHGFCTISADVKHGNEQIMCSSYYEGGLTLQTHLSHAADVGTVCMAASTHSPSSQWAQPEQPTELGEANELVLLPSYKPRAAVPHCLKSDVLFTFSSQEALRKYQRSDSKIRGFEKERDLKNKQIHNVSWRQSFERLAAYLWLPSQGWAESSTWARWRRRRSQPSRAQRSWHPWADLWW